MDDCGLALSALSAHSILSIRVVAPIVRRVGTNCVTDLISTYFSKSAIRNPQSAIRYAIFPGEVALSAIGELQIKEVANHEENGNADFPDDFGGS
jgi:hypothetical protein